MAVSEAFVWGRCLSGKERTAVFVRGAAGHGALDAAYAWRLLTGAERAPVDPRIRSVRGGIGWLPRT